MADQAALDKYRSEIVNDITKYVEDGVVFRIGEVRADIQNAVKFLNQYIEDGVAFRLEEIKGKLDAITARLDALEANQ